MTKQIKDKQSASMPKHDMSELVRREYVNFINTTYMPTHYLVVRLPEHWETINLDYAKSRLRLIMKVFEKSLIKNHWNKHHLPFIVTAEKGCGITDKLIDFFTIGAKAMYEAEKSVNKNDEANANDE